jgi:hypothetical protein
MADFWLVTVRLGLRRTVTLVAHVVDLQHSDASAVIDGGELIEAFPGACNPLKEFDVDLQSVPRLWLLVSMPGAACRLALLIGRQAVHPITDQDAVHRGSSHVYVMKAVEIAVDPGRSKSVTLPQIQDFGDHITGCCARKVRRRSRPIAQAGVTVAFVPGSPFIVGFAGETEMPANLSHAPR